MKMRFLGLSMVLLGLLLLILTVMAWRELNSVATSKIAPTADSLMLTRFFSPELFDSGKAGAKPAHPAELAEAAFRRIYTIGGCSFTGLVIGILLLVTPSGPRREQNLSQQL